LKIKEIDGGEEDNDESESSGLLTETIGLRTHDEDGGSGSNFEIDEDDLRLLKNARVRLEGPNLASVGGASIGTVTIDKSKGLTSLLTLPSQLMV
jgi:hypothetical protein